MKFCVESFEPGLGLWVKAGDAAFDTFEEAEHIANAGGEQLRRVGRDRPEISAGTTFNITLHCTVVGQLPNGDMKVHIHIPNGNKAECIISARDATRFVAEISQEEVVPLEGSIPLYALDNVFERNASNLFFCGRFMFTLYERLPEGPIESLYRILEATDKHALVRLEVRGHAQAFWVDWERLMSAVRGTSRTR